MFDVVGGEFDVLQSVDWEKTRFDVLAVETEPFNSKLRPVADDAAIPRNDATFTYQDLLESPFFVIQNLRPLPEVQTNARSRLLSGNISKTARALTQARYS